MLLIINKKIISIIFEVSSSILIYTESTAAGSINKKLFVIVIKIASQQYVYKRASK